MERRDEQRVMAKARKKLEEMLREHQRAFDGEMDMCAAVTEGLMDQKFGPWQCHAEEPNENRE